MYRLSFSEQDRIQDFCENDMDADTMVKLLGNDRVVELITEFIDTKHWLPELVELYIEKLGESWADAILDAERVENDLYL